MTLYVNNTTEFVTTNNIEVVGDVSFILTGGYSKTDTILPATIVFQNARYTKLEVTFPADFKDQHKNGIYYYTISNPSTIFEKGYCKIITQPGGETGTISYDSGVITEERKSDVYFRPNY